MNKLITLVFTSILFAASATVSAGPQQEKMKSCNKEAKSKSLKGDERKAFMKTCLSSKTTRSAIAKKPDMTADTKN